MLIIMQRFSETDISQPLLEWWDAGHANLPWRTTRDPYAIWVSEIMLQQTQITTVIPYYERWLAIPGRPWQSLKISLLR